MKSQKQRQTRKIRLQSRGGVGYKRYITKNLGFYDKYYDNKFDVWKGFISRNQGKTFFKRIAELKQNNLEAYMDGIKKLLFTDKKLISKTYGKDVLDDVEDKIIKNQDIPEDLESKKNTDFGKYMDYIETLYNLVWGSMGVSEELVKNKYGKNVWNDLLDFKKKEDTDTAVLSQEQNKLNVSPEELKKLEKETVDQAIKDYNDGIESQTRRGIELDANKVEVNEKKGLLPEIPETLSEDVKGMLPPINDRLQLTKGQRGNTNNVRDIEFYLKGGRKKRKTRNAKRKSRRYK